MDAALWIMTLYGGAYGLLLVKLTYDMGHEFHHWMFGLITTIAIIPVIIINVLIPRDYFASTVIMGLIVGPTSFFMDFHDFKKWLKKREKEAVKELQKIKTRDSQLKSHKN